MDESILICPITKSFYAEPVLAEDGHVYEKEAIEQWININKISPLTRESIHSKLVPIFFIKTLVDTYLTQNPDKKELQYVPVLDFIKNKIKIFEFIKNGEFNELLKYTNYKITQLLDNTFKIKLYKKNKNKSINYFYYILKNCKDDGVIRHIIQNKVLGTGNRYIWSLMSEQFIIDYITTCSDNKLHKLKKTSQQKWNILHFLSKRGFIEAIKSLLIRIPAFELDKLTIQKYTALSFAIKYKHYDIIRLLVENGVDVAGNIQSSKNSDIKILKTNHLMECVFNSLSFDIIKYIIENGKYISQNKESVLQNLLVAVVISYNHSKDQKQFIEYLIKDCKVPINLMPKNNYVIHFACKYSSSKIIKLLVDLECKLDITDKNGYIPLMLALLYKKFDAFKYMISKGANMNVVTDIGSHIVHWLAQNASYKLFNEMNEKYKFDLNVKNNSGYSLLSYALADNEDWKISELLINNGVDVDVDVAGADGWKPIHYALKCKSNNIKLLKVLISKIIDIDSNIDDKLYRPLHLACCACDEEIVRILIEKGCNLEFATEEGYKPIHLITKTTKYSDDLIRYMVDEKKVELNCEDKCGIKPIHNIALYRSTELIKYILSKGVNIETNIKDEKTGEVIYTDFFQLLMENPNVKSHIKSFFSL